MNAQVISVPAFSNRGDSTPPTPKVNLGGQYTGKPEGHADTRTGVYWESLPTVVGDALQLQKGLLKPKKGAPPLIELWKKSLDDVKKSRENRTQ